MTALTYIVCDARPEVVGKHRVFPKAWHELVSAGVANGSVLPLYLIVALFTEKWSSVGMPPVIRTIYVCMIP